MSSIAEEEWREYLVRRERELNRDVDDSTRPSGRFELVPKRQQSATLADDKRRALKGDGSFNLPSNVYHSSGYASRPSELGEDPLSSVRTMRSQMRSLATRYRNSDTPVRAHLCEAACDRLSAAEGQLITMARERTGAVLVGDSRRAEQLTVEMEKVKEGAIRDSYSDLVMDKQEMRAFGVNSEWSPLPVEQPPKPSTPSPAATATRPSSVSRGATPTKRKPPRPPQGTSGTQTEASVVHKVEKKVQKMQENPPREVKKNGRLSDLAVSPMAIQPNDAQHDDPYQLPNTAGSCQFCGETAPDFGEATRIEAHYKSACMMMTKCRFCSKVVLAPQLTDHIVSRCPFVTGRMTECHACGLAVDATDDANRVKHPMCRGRAPPSGAQWCPLCAVAVDNTSHGWKQHLQTICYNNPRRNGPEIDIDPNLMVGDGRAARPSSTKSVRSMKAVAGRTIDADKLVAALQTVQLRKKQDAAKKKAAIAGKSEAVDGTQSAK